MSSGGVHDRNDAVEDWRPPGGGWIMEQTWSRLLFAHYPVPRERLQGMLPEGLPLDTYEGEAWVSIVPFKMGGIRLRGLPRVPGTPSFGELNVRTYVAYGGDRGVYFFTLDANSRLAVWLANATYALPYRLARMRVAEEGDATEFQSVRTDHRNPGGGIDVRYGPTGPVYRSEPGSLEEWLTERYSLYVAKGDALYRGRIAHAPWPLQPAYADLRSCTVAESVGIPVSGPPALLQYAERLSMVAWAPERVE